MRFANKLFCCKFVIYLSCATSTAPKRNWRFPEESGLNEVLCPDNYLDLVVADSLVAY